MNQYPSCPKKSMENFKTLIKGTEWEVHEKHLAEFDAEPNNEWNPFSNDLKSG